MLFIVLWCLSISSHTLECLLLYQDTCFFIINISSCDQRSMKLLGDGPVAFIFHMDMYNLCSEPLRQLSLYFCVHCGAHNNTKLPIGLFHLNWVNGCIKA